MGLRLVLLVGSLAFSSLTLSSAELQLSEQWAEYEGLVPKPQHVGAKKLSSLAHQHISSAAPDLSKQWAQFEDLQKARMPKKQLQGLRMVPEGLKSSGLQGLKQPLLSGVKDLSDKWASFEHIEEPEAHSAAGAKGASVASQPEAKVARRADGASVASKPKAQHHKAIHQQVQQHQAKHQLATKPDQAKHHRLAKLEGDGAEESADEDKHEDEDEGFDSEEAANTLQGYVEAHPGFAADACAWLAAGLVIFIIACLVLLFSEVRVVLVVRDQDFRRDMQMRGYMQETERVKELEDKETASQAARPYLTATCMILLFVAIICILKPFCNVLDIIGLPSSNCFLTVGFGAFVGSVTVTSFIMGMCWSCTRGWAALVLLTIAITGDLMCTTGVPFLVLLWLVLAGGLFFYYFIYLPETADCPAWCQAIGPIKASMDPVEWKKAAHSSASASLEDLSSALASVPGGQGLAEAASQAAERARNADPKDGTVDKARNTATV